MQDYRHLWKKHSMGSKLPQKLKNRRLSMSFHISHWKTPGQQSLLVLVPSRIALSRTPFVLCVERERKSTSSITLKWSNKRTNGLEWIEPYVFDGIFIKLSSSAAVIMWDHDSSEWKQSNKTRQQKEANEIHILKGWVEHLICFYHSKISVVNQAYRWMENGAQVDKLKYSTPNFETES